MGDLDGLLTNMNLFEQRNTIPPIIDMSLSQLLKEIQQPRFYPDVKGKTIKKIEKFRDRSRAVAIRQVPISVGGTRDDLDPTEYFVKEYNTLCNEIVKDIAEKSFFNKEKEEMTDPGLDIEIEECPMPLNVLGNVLDLLNSQLDVEYETVLPLFSKEFVSLPVQFVVGLAKLDSALRNGTCDGTISDRGSHMDYSQDNAIRCASLDFLEILFSDLLFGDTERTPQKVQARLASLAEQLLMQMGHVLVMKKKYTAIIYLMLRGGLKYDLLTYLATPDCHALPPLFVELVKIYIGRTETFNQQHKYALEMAMKAFIESKDYFGILVCSIMSGVEVIGRFREIDVVVKYSLDDFIWYYLTVLSNDIERRKTFMYQMSCETSIVYPYLYCVVSQFTQCLAILLHDTNKTYENIIAVIMMCELLERHDMITISKANTLEQLMKRGLIETNCVFNKAKFILLVIKTYQPTPVDIQKLLNLLDRKYYKEALIKVVVEYGRSDMMNEDGVLCDVECVETISRKSELENPEVAMMVNSITGNMNEYVRIINDRAAMMLNDRGERENARNELGRVTDIVLKDVNDIGVRNDFYLLNKICDGYDACERKDIQFVMKFVSEGEVFPVGFPGIDQCVVNIQTIKSYVLRKVLNGIYFEFVNLLIEFLNEAARTGIVNSNLNVPVVKEIVKSCFVVISFLPQYFVEQPFLQLMNANRYLLA
ncbi:hypothetical protein EIN_093470 [Entamoeba invadens IP1]|uniref:Nuclear pore protein n=1 Tax=Entamoeba invadens IP1 TaxID=370355 RepID=A0A0A1TZW4_ENTIV|nr:hypothetical protein EIN_093470 [Entamoeba invadens IP1]ELP87190.1 hypothetical protein EIN_093470 [Entamoeba invadens IP1]|eukprot:XP_004253961.1 hypothetical protein EIN_093470 [Entamoeba invadens IP1]